ncbi:MSMEG_0569 family flavin-dependent oxidoreductase [Zavarzinia compransoris]|uniref:MSMEG_0569 family flavin-dependent oxidoreductase n=1 Tax=Zavarzinia marina TaxID=2911065 RepID=UPI001F2B3B97|nr:MSMEG_0569 family flavin-dependent oxidoreductase [Zavarzinia marina]MCF4166135.1 MSMEG_0569 family flavin-dependent oxidoreductase [Zavarzinia marina]
MTTPNTHYPVIVVGGGQAGLSISYFLQEAGIEHLVLEKHRPGHAWRTERWDNFCLVTPNWQCQLPGFPYPGQDPFGFMKKDEVLDYIDAYVERTRPPLRTGVTVDALRRRDGAGFELETSAGTFTADQVVIAVGGYHIPSIPRVAERLPASVAQIHSSRYRNAAALPPGAVLVVGSGQSGCQIAEDLHIEGRKVHLCVGSAPRAPRRYRGRDAVEWLHDMGHYDMPIERHPLKERVRGKANHYLTGRDGGREIDLRRFALEGMELHGRLTNVAGGRLHFADDLARNLDAADETYNRIRAGIDAHIAAKGIEAPVDAPYVAPWRPGALVPAIDLAEAGIATVIWATGFRSNFTWVEVPAFDGKGYPTHRRGVSAVPGLYFLGLPWLHTWGSGRFSGIARDAAHIAGQIARRDAASDRRTG